MPSGTSENALADAIRLSGYPMQAVAAAEIEKVTHVTEEWGYRDRITNEQRSLDIFGYCHFDSKLDALRPALIVLAECKRATHPLVFFKPGTERSTSRAPALAGMKQSVFTVHFPGGNQEVDHAQFLGLGEFEFVRGSVPSVMTMARAQLNGKKVEISGEMPHNSLVLPLISALDHLRASWQATPTPAALAVCLGVIDAPMMLAAGTPESLQLTLTPWVRLLRHEAAQDARSNPRHYVIDCVHRWFLGDYLSKHLLPFAKQVANRMNEKPRSVVSQQAWVPNRKKWSWEDLREAP